MEDIFISNCMETATYFQGAILIGVKGRGSLCMIMANDNFIGEWTFSKSSSELSGHSIV